MSRSDKNTRHIRYHSSDDMARLGELAGVMEPCAVVIRPGGSVDVYGYIGVVDQRPDTGECAICVPVQCPGASCPGSYGASKPERITKDDSEWLHCLCGNTPDMSGFDSCLTDGTQVEPLADGPWDGRLYVCLDCGRIVDQYTLEVVGRTAATS